MKSVVSFRYYVIGFERQTAGENVVAVFDLKHRTDDL